MNQYIITYRIEDKYFTSADSESSAKEETIAVIASDYEVNEDDIEIIEVKILN